MTQPTRKRKQISLDIKFAIIKQHNDGMRPVDIEKLYEYTSSTVSTIIKNKDKIVKEYENNVAANGAKRNKLTMQIHRTKYHEIDKAVDTWFAESISQTNDRRARNKRTSLTICCVSSTTRVHCFKRMASEIS